MIFGGFISAVIEELKARFRQLILLFGGKALVVFNEAEIITFSNQGQIDLVKRQGGKHASGLTISTENNVFVDWAVKELLLSQLAVNTLRKKHV